jgi:RimJ/RimL family protein N-acetyltransferase
MSIPDGIMEDWFIVYTELPMTEIAGLKKLIKKDPREAKLRLATAIVARYHGAEAGRAERDWFEAAFSKKTVPDDIPTLPVVSPDIACFDLVKLTRPEKSKSDTRRLIKQGGVELNGDKVTDPDERLLVKTNDILKVGKRHWYRIEIVSFNVIETERLWLKPLEIEDIDLLVKYLPEWEIVKYLTRPTAAKVLPAKPGAAQPFKLMTAPAAASSKVSEGIAKEVFKKVISQAEPKDEWLWKIVPKAEPEEIIGVAHLRRDFEFGNQNVWIEPAHKGQGFTSETVAALNTHAFENLNFTTMVFKDAFAHAARDIEDLRSHFSKLDVKATEAAGASFHVTREAWAQMQPPPQQTQPPQQPPGLPVVDPFLEELLRQQECAQQMALAAPPPASPPAPTPVTPPAQVSPLSLPQVWGAPPPPVPAAPPVALPPGVIPPPGWVPGMPLPPAAQPTPAQTPAPPMLTPKPPTGNT